jgi:quinol-cytochrome oxidoreductase complex cytochrome b subunit
MRKALTIISILAFTVCTVTARNQPITPEEYSRDMAIEATGIAVMCIVGLIAIILYFFNQKPTTEE